MKRLMQDMASAILYHIVFVSVLGGLAMFVWNSGITELFSSYQNKITYTVALAIITGIYIVDLFIKSYINKITNYKRQQYYIDLMLGKPEKEKRNRRKK